MRSSNRLESFLVFTCLIPVCANCLTTTTSVTASATTSTNVSTDEFLYGHLYNMYGNTVELIDVTWPTYWVFIDQLASSFNAYCNKHPRTCCRNPASIYRATGQELTFMTVDDIVTLPGYPRRLSPRHAQTMLVFYHNADSELCRAVNALGRRRRRRQASDTTWPTLQFTDYDRVVTNGLVDAAIANPALTEAELVMGMAIHDLLGYESNLTVVRGDLLSAVNGQTATTLGGSGTGSENQYGYYGLPWWWVLLLIIIGCLILLLLIIILIIILWRLCKKRRRRRRAVYPDDTETDVKSAMWTQTEEPEAPSPPPTWRPHGATLTHTATSSYTEEEYNLTDVVVDQSPRPQAVAIGPPGAGARASRGPDVQQPPPDRWEGSSNVRPGRKYKSTVGAGGADHKPKLEPATPRTKQDSDSIRRLLESQLPAGWEGSSNVRPGHKYKSPEKKLGL